MATAVSLFHNMSAILAAIQDFSKKLFLAKLQPIFLKLLENMFLMPQIIELITKNFVKKFSVSNFNLHN